MAPNSLPSRLESGNVLVSYNPRRFIRQFRLDKGAVVKTGKVCPSLRETEHQYTLVGRDALLGQHASIFCPSLLRQVFRSPGGVLHCTRCTEIFRDLIHLDSDTPRQVARPLTIYVRDLYLRGRRGMEDKMILSPVNQGDEDHLGSPIPIRIEGSKATAPHPASTQSKRRRI